MRFPLSRFYKNTTIRVVLIIVILVVGYIYNTKEDSKENSQSESEQTRDVSSNSEIDKTIQALFEKRNDALLKKDIKYLESIYDIENKLGRWAYEHEIKKIKYIGNWSEKQGIEFVEINPIVVVKSIKEKEDKFSVYLLCSTEYKYKYKDEEAVNSSRIGTYHVIDLVEKNESLKIIKEWYDDPFAGSMDLEKLKDEEITLFINSQHLKEGEDLSQNRKDAVDYAHRYSGAASLKEYGFKYNKEYRDYNSEGGDCTNFISQVLLEGGFKKNQAWNYNSSGATKAWVNASGFKDYITYSGRGSVISQGDYKNVYKHSYSLIQGDVISYEKKGKISHTAVVTSFDSKGYPLVTCHNTDRNNVPWDLGFNGKDIKFHFIKMNY